MTERERDALEHAKRLCFTAARKNEPMLAFEAGVEIEALLADERMRVIEAIDAFAGRAGR